MKNFFGLKASAGSGKTFALSVRYVALLLKGAKTQNIIALTFTKKAASEMSERIVSLFLNLDQKKAELAEISKLLRISENEVIDKRDELKSDFLSSNLKIMTFDAFFSTILRSFSLNLGLNPDYDIKDIGSDVFKENFINQIAKDEKLLKSLAIYILEFSKGQNDFFETLEMLYDNFSEINIAGGVSYPNDNKVMSLCNQIKTYIQNKNGSNTAINAFNVANALELCEKSVIQRESLNYQTFSKVYDDELDVYFDELKDELQKYINGLEKYKLNELNQFLKTYKDIKTDLNKKLNELSFSDITRLTNELLYNNLDKQMLYFRLDGTISHLLIDEFQDTNVTQYNIIFPIIEEIVAGYGQTGLGSFFYVGDIKQSIYRFRGGKKELFDKLKDDFKQIEVESLKTNYRSAKFLVEFVNEKMKDKFNTQNSNQEDNFTEQIPNSDKNGYIKVAECDDVVQSCVDEAKRLLDLGVQSKDITVLCWKNDDIKTICDKLKAQNIPSTDEGAMLLKNSKPVFGLINYAKFCLFEDRIYCQNFISYFGFEPTKVKLDLNKTANECLYYLAKIANISMQDLDILRLFEISSSSSDIVSFLFEFENSDEKAINSDSFGVRVMTTHKSKGLEFDTVILCDKLSKGRQGKGRFICEYDIKSGWQIKLNVSNREFFDKEYKKLIEQSESLDKEEEINKLYVALTRAKNNLIILKTNNPDASRPSYFSKYKLKSGKVYDYLDLEICEKGSIKIEQNSSDSTSKTTKKIELVSVEKDTTTNKEKEYELNLNSIYFGTALHFLLEMTKSFDEKSLRYQEDALRDKFSKFLSKDELDEIVTRCINLVNDSDFKELVKDSVIKKEQSIYYKEQTKQLDLMSVKNYTITIVDYKSSKKDIENNKKQVLEYTKIVKEIYPDMKVCGIIFYVLKDGIEKIII
ncbi:exonuclease V, helicase AddA [Campylobacter pinnipediorum subsp. caledonicus]|uniref:DNA 3'-5' helicase n=1 Tax=Campylobacter pinnipediorum subsp. caledonicus TaxID=1874362 RepID=A0A1S6U6Z6_9BACT|nr:RecB-like helicase [Campylobacter pinnipediorum]AQW87227.1 exonuclease V, helicase AddA [Campylobacter pinnipediorum subsp. caledonicus]